MKKIVLLTLIATFASALSFAQTGRVGIGTSTPEQKLDVAGNAKASDKVIATRGFVAGSVTTDTAKAVFATDITNKGFYIPRLTTAEKTTLGSSLVSANKGLLVFDTNLNRVDFWDGTAWKAVGDGAGGPPSGTAGGDLTGTYPNPTIANNAVTGNKILDGTITNDDIQNNTIDLTAKVNNVLRVQNGGTGVNTVTGAIIGNGSSPVSGVASSSGNQVLRRNNGNSAYEFAQVQYSDVAGTPSALPPSGAAGGNLSGSYPNPAIADDAVTGAKILNGTVTNADINDVAWTKVTGKPTTLSGYGITDAVPSARTITLAATANQTSVSAGAQDLSANRTWTIGTVQDIATSSSPTFNNVTSTGNFIGRTFINDTRSVNAAPSTYSNQMAYEFKERATIGAPGTGTYGGLITMAPWNDNSGNNDHQLHFNDGGIFYRNGNAAGTNVSDWGSWSQVLTSANDVVLNSQDALHKRLITTFSRTIGANAGDYVYLGTFKSNGAGTYVSIRESHHFCGTINAASYEILDPYYAGATTDWMQVPTQNYRSHTGAQDFTLDVRRTAVHPTEFEIRARSLGGACSGGTMFFELQTNGTYTASTTTGSGGTVAGYLSSNAYQFPISNNNFKTSTDGLFMLNSGNVGIGIVAPTAKLHIGGTAGVDGIKFPDATLQKSAAAYKKMYQTTLSAASQNIDITGLDLDAASVYEIYFTTSSTVGGEVRMFFNGNYTATNYYSQHFHAYEGNTGMARRNYPEIGTMSANEGRYIKVSLMRGPDGFARFLSHETGNNNGGAGEHIYGGRYTTSANVTQIRLHHTGGSFAVGTKVIIVGVQ